MSLIQEFMPRWRLRQVDRVAVAAEPEKAFRAVRSFDLHRVPVARRLFALRTLPRRVAGWLRGRDEPLGDGAGFDQITAAGTGFHLLGENRREVVVGSVGRFWKPSIEFAPVTAETFAAHDERGWGKLAWSIAVAGRQGGGSWITIDLRVDAGDPTSWTRFTRYWRLIGPFSHGLRQGAMRLFRRDLGAAEPDDARALAGDDILPAARVQLTHAIDIEAPTSGVWPWLVQMGRRRAGWYSWDRLDNGGVPSAGRIIPELQQLAAGDVLPVRPTGTDGFIVQRIVPERALVLRNPPGGPFDGTWTFALEPIGDDATHLVARYRADYQPSPRMVAVRAVMAPLHAFMERKQLRTIKQRVES